MCKSLIFLINNNRDKYIFLKSIALLFFDDGRLVPLLSTNCFPKYFIPLFLYIKHVQKFELFYK